MSPEEIQSLLKQSFTDAEVACDGDGSHFSVRVVSDDFEGLSAVKKQQRVYQAVNEHIQSGAIHALTMQTFTHEEWKKASKLQIG
ncbi:BolA family protein [Pleionea sp. CnH1-48]|uniref:BolA family protein n=1 Tax=Pleionea sp. CnH1-48 TaxID=2954494 RepID=UPI00209724D0|nr:BolA/IbaG family iron-sulfur metabolism protein [Pleionea sp. CnH1-48]MCO7224026.1 BolA/IbaG family iron-sulfur metabolism protein [Pleionea sp. CnH1-48]